MTYTNTPQRAMYFRSLIFCFFLMDDAILLLSAGVSDEAYKSRDVEVSFAIDATIAANIGGADVWSDGVRGESKLQWRITTPATIASVVNDTSTSLVSWSREVCGGTSNVLVVDVQG